MSIFDNDDDKLRGALSTRLADLLNQRDTLGRPSGPFGLASLALRPDTEAFIEAVWQKAAIAAGFDPRCIRKDRYGHYIARSAYGQRTTLGWHIDHVFPRSLGGSDELFNREALHWENNLAKSDKVI